MIYKRGLSSYSKHDFPFCRAVKQMFLVCKVTFWCAVLIVVLAHLYYCTLDTEAI